MLAGASLVYACFGALVSSMAVLVEPISADLSLSAMQMGTLLGAWQFVYLFTAIPAGYLLDRFGIRPCLLLAGLLMASSALIRVIATNYLGLMFAVMLFGVGGPLISIGAPKLVARWFAGAERSLAMGIYSSSVGVGMLLALFGTHSVLMPLVGHSWQNAFMVYATLTLASVAVWLAIMSRPISQLGNEQRAASAVGIGVFADLLRVPVVRVLLLFAIVVFYYNHTLQAWLPEVLRQRGLSASTAGFLAGIPALVAIPAVFILPRFATEARQRWLMRGIVTIGIVGVLLISIVPPAWFVVPLTLQGLARGCLYPMIMLALMNAEGMDAGRMGAASGLFFTAAEIGGVLGPLLGGGAIDATANYNTPLWLCALVLVPMLLFVGRAFGRPEPPRPAIPD